MKSLNRIRALILQELYITSHALEVLLDSFMYPIISTLLFAFIFQYVSKASGQIAFNLLIGTLLWEIVYVSQSSMAFGTLWNLWSRNLSNIFISPISIWEYFAAYLVSGFVKSMIVFAATSVTVYFLFHFSILVIGWLNLILFTFSLVFFSFSFSIIVLGIIFRFGREMQALAWGLTPLLQPLCAAVFPIDVLPRPFQYIAYVLPPTYIFEAARSAFTSPIIRFDLIGISLIENIVYFGIAILFFRAMYRSAKVSGQFVRNEA